MSVDKLVDSTQLDSDLTSVANAIRAKSGGSSQLAFPSGFVSEIGNIPSGGVTEVTISDSGAVAQALDPDKIYHFTGNLTALTITLTGNPAESEYQFDFTAGSTAPTFSIPSSVSVSAHFEILARNKTTICIKNNKVFIVDETPIIPSAYTRVNSISIPFGGFVNTGIVPFNKANTIVFDARLDTPVSSISTSATMYGARESTAFYAQLAVFYAYSGFTFSFGAGSVYAVMQTKDNNRHLFYSEPFMATLAVDRNAASKPANATLPQNPILIGARQVQSGSGFERYAAETVWSYRHIVDLVCAINLIPCKRNSDSEYGFFDTVSGNFFGNSGTGTFSEGVE